jgi:hypothetical protein
MIKLKPIIAGISILLIPALLKAQNFQSIGSPLIRTVRCMYADTIANKLYTGNDYMAPSANGLHVWDGTTWDTLGFVITPVRSINKFQGDMVVANGYLRRWNGTSWADLATIPTFGGVFGLYNDNDSDLYSVGGFDTLNGVIAGNIAKWNGTAWSAIDTSHWSGPATCSIIYQGNLYVGGNYLNSTGSINSIAKWDGVTWNGMNGGLTGGSGVVNCLAVYNNELYVAGSFYNIGGMLINSIAKWDGSQWSDVGGSFKGINQMVYDMQVFNGELYAAGIFDSVGGQAIEDIAKWDGTNWCGLGFSHVNPGRGVLALSVLNNELYLGGGFLDIGGDTMNYVTKWAGGSFTSVCGNTTGVNDSQQATNEVKIYPNPASDQIILEFEGQNTIIEVKNSLGQTIYIENTEITGKQVKAIDISSFSNGIYLLSLQMEHRIISRKFIKQ